MAAPPTNRLCLRAALFLLVSAYATAQTVLVDSSSTVIDGNYTIGYLNVTQAGSIAPVPLCHRVGMLKFAPGTTGLAQRLSFLAYPGAATETCSATLWLFNFATQAQIGAAVAIQFTVLAASAGSTSGTESTNAIDISAGNWVLTAGQEYYFEIQTFTWDAFGNHCKLVLPWGMASAPVWGVVTQAGPPSTPCGGTPWTTDVARDGGTFLFTITGTTTLPPSTSQTPVATPSATPTLGTSTVTLVSSAAAGATSIAGNVTIGYFNVTSAGGVSTAACNRVSLWKFPAAASGVATAISLLVLPAPATEECAITLWLYTFGTNTQVGGSVLLRFDALAATSATETSSLDVSSAGWTLMAGTEYYLVGQTFTWDLYGNRCHFTLPYAMASAPATPTNWGLVVQRGPADTPCGGTPWSGYAAVDGGTLMFSITGQALTPTSTPTSSATPTGGGGAGLPSGTPTVTGSPSTTAPATLTSSWTGTPSGTPSSTTAAIIISPSSSSAATPSASLPPGVSLSGTASTAPASASASSGSTASVSASMAVSGSPTVSISLSAAGTPSAGGTGSPTGTPSLPPSGSGSASLPPSGSSSPTPSLTTSPTASGTTSNTRTRTPSTTGSLSMGSTPSITPSASPTVGTLDNNENAVPTASSSPGVVAGGAGMNTGEGVAIGIAVVALLALIAVGAYAFVLRRRMYAVLSSQLPRKGSGGSVNGTNTHGSTTTLAASPSSSSPAAPGSPPRSPRGSMSMSLDPSAPQHIALATSHLLLQQQQHSVRRVIGHSGPVRTGSASARHSSNGSANPLLVAGSRASTSGRGSAAFPATPV